MELVLKDVDQCNVYLDDVKFHHLDWAYDNCCLVIFLMLLSHLIWKSEFTKATVTYLSKQSQE